MLNLANGLAAVGEHVDLVLAEAKGELMHRVDHTVRLVDLRGGSGVLRSMPALGHYLRTERPGCLITALDYVNVLAILARALVGSRTRLFVTCHNSLIDAVRNSPWRRDRLLPALVRLTYRHADGVIAVSQGVAHSIAAVAHLPPERINVIPNPAIDPSFDRRAAEALSHPWFLEGGPPVILGAGSLTLQKDFPTLIQAFALVRKHCAARLIILGDGEERDHLERLVLDLGLAQDVQLPGWVENPYPYMAKSRLFVLSSRWEGFSLVLVEALACGTPVVSTHCPSGPSEILDDGRYGVLVPVADASAMAAAIVDALNRKPNRDALRERAYEFTRERCVSKYLACLRQAAMDD